ncbi:hypothetical protein A0U40_04470 [[Bacillus] sp. KCTC 13219]|nr:hypothetical protein A0U40_04470 [[Bacillus] sp. KCTC 13219]
MKIIPNSNKLVNSLSKPLVKLKEGGQKVAEKAAAKATELKAQANAMIAQAKQGMRESMDNVGRALRGNEPQFATVGGNGARNSDSVVQMSKSESVSSGGAFKGTGEIGWSLPKGGGEINGRNYSKHALERMAPDTSEVRAALTSRAIEKAKELGYKPQTKEFSDFIKKYVDPRNIPPSVIEDAIMNSKKIPGNRSGTFVHETRDVKVIINEAGDVITVIPK